MHLIELPPMAIGVETSGVLDTGINGGHMLEAPKTRRNYLSHGKFFDFQATLRRSASHRKENGHQRKANTSRVHLVLKIWYALLVTTVPLVQKTINTAMILRQTTRSSLKVETHVKCGVPGCLYKNKLS